MPLAVCGICKESFPLKSNLAAGEELERLSIYLAASDDPGCPHWSYQDLKAIPREGLPATLTNAMRRPRSYMPTSRRRIDRAGAAVIKGEIGQATTGNRLPRT